MSLGVERYDSKDMISCTMDYFSLQAFREIETASQRVRGSLGVSGELDPIFELEASVARFVTSSEIVSE